MTLLRAENPFNPEEFVVTVRVPSLRRPPIGFAHRGARATAPENTLEAFRLALRLGVTGLESDVWVTADGVPVLDHDGRVGSRLRRRTIADVRRDQLPAHIPSLEDLYADCGTDFQLSLDVKDPAAFDTVVAVAKAAGDDVVGRLWLCHHDWQVVAGWRHVDGLRLVDSTRLSRLKEGPERRAATLSKVGIDAINLHHIDWTGGLTTLFHRFRVLAFGWDAQLRRVIDELLTIGLDGIYSDHADVLHDAISAHKPPMSSNG
jgi:glycerophosphoryl diester phosphodiesterase